LLIEYDTTGQILPPTLDDLVNINVESEPLAHEGVAAFHSSVAKILYCAKCIRGELLPEL